jgi:phage tail-like protein
MAVDEAKILFKLSGPDLTRDEIVIGRQGLRVGRSADNTLPLNHREISRQHMRVVWRDDAYWVEDLNSSNGVWLNDLRIKPRVPEVLEVGDVVRCGPYLLRFDSLVYPEPEILERPSGDQLLPLEPLPSRTNGVTHPPGIPHQQSNWLQYLPAIYSDDEFMGRYLLIFESILSPIIWMIDNFDLYLSPDIAPPAWLQWMASWFDLLVLPELPPDRQRELMRQLGWLFMRRGTRSGLQRMLELYFGVTPEIIENEACQFVVRLPLSESKSDLGAEVADRLIMSQKPAFASYILEVI